MDNNSILVVSLYNLERNPGIVEIFEEYFESITGLRDNYVNVRKEIPEYNAILIAIGLNNPNLIRILRKFHRETSCVFIDECVAPKLNLTDKEDIKKALSSIEEHVKNNLGWLSLTEIEPPF